MSQQSTQFHHILRLALEEDIGKGDLTAGLVPEDTRVTARVICREDAVIAGAAWFSGVFALLDPTLDIDWKVSDGDRVEANTTLVEISGLARPILTGERSALNFLQTLSATATRTRSYVDAIAGTHARILDTRKTLPGLREAQKYAVTCGGGTNHRIGLFDAILIKENHILAAGSITAAMQKARQLNTQVKIEVEVENLMELEEAINAGANAVLLDNMSTEQLRAAVALNAGRVSLEASGGVTLETVRAIAETGVDFISVGTLTKDIKAIDLSMRFDYE
ncbi:MAG: carboxylating nicotinate-nucleotide diphosphorylase [Gammaproteobacteria bacterium]|nr:carboxylating nicotinate-nucleotide diphosphorylase [Gammaproteobacteria bacterium]